MGEPLRKWPRLGLLCAVLGGLGQTAAAAPPAEGASPVTCTVRVIHLLPGGAEFDPRLESLHELHKPPFSAWKTVKLLEQQDLKLQKDVPASFKIPGDHQGALVFQELVEGHRRRLRLRLDLHDGSAKLLKTNYLIDNGGTFFNAGIHHGGGVVALAVTCQLTKPS